MALAFKTTTIALGMALLCLATGSAALTLGRLQGGATLGRPLDVQIQIVLDGNDDAQACMVADVSYGSTALAPSQVTVRVDAPATAGSMASSVRVMSAVLVDEPIVSLSLHSGCVQKSSRQYTLFADLAAPATAAAPSVPAVPVQSVPAAVTARDAVPPRAVVPTVRPPVAAPRAVAPAAPKPQAKSVAQRKTNNRPRLRLDPLDLVLEQDPVLQVSNELLTLPQEEDVVQRAQAAAWWRALNASPEEILHEAARLQAVQDNIQSLQTIAAKNQTRLNGLAEKLERAESEKYANALVYSLLALCAVSLLGLGFFWRRSRQLQAPSWSHGVDASDSLMADFDPAPEPDPEPDPHSKSAAPAVKKAQEPGSAVVPMAMTEVDLDLDLDVSEPMVSAAPPPQDFSISIFPGARAMDTEEMLDIRQQADFFLALGQYDSAIEVLSTHIAQCGESSPLICLDLLKVYHMLGRKEDFNFLRSEFNHWFTGRVPDFSTFLNEGGDLESYPQVLNRIRELWPTPSVLDYIENCIYHHTGEQQGADFDLHAYRDLLLLHSIAKRIIRMGNGDEDANVSEFLRMPASTYRLDDEDPTSGTDSRAAMHRAGAHLRGGWNGRSRASTDNADDADDADDPQAEIETRSAPLGGMRVPTPAVPAPSVIEPLELELEPVEETNKTTDFNFLGLR